MQWTLAQPGNAEVRSVNALVGRDQRRRAERHPHAGRAPRACGSPPWRPHAAGPVDEGSVGAGTGTRAFGWKGGIGTVVAPPAERSSAATRVGVLVQSNYGGVLTDGRRAGGQAAWPLRVSAAGRTRARSRNADDDPGDGSCMIVVATDAPLDARDLKRLAARAVFGLARTGSSFSNGSGDFAVAFSTSPSLRVRFGAEAAAPRTLLPTDGVSPLFQAALEATEEAVYNSLFSATTVTSAVGTAEALPVERVREILARYKGR